MDKEERDEKAMLVRLKRNVWERLSIEAIKAAESKRCVLERILEDHFRRQDEKKGGH